MLIDIVVKAEIFTVSLQRCKITQSCPTEPRRHQQTTNCELPLDRENEDRQEKSNFQKDVR